MNKKVRLFLMDPSAFTEEALNKLREKYDVIENRSELDPDEKLYMSRKEKEYMTYGAYELVNIPSIIKPIQRQLKNTHLDKNERLLRNKIEVTGFQKFERKNKRANF